MAVDGLAMKMTKFFEIRSEGRRSGSAQRNLQQGTSEDPNCLDLGSVASDGTMTTSIVVEFKNSHVGISAAVPRVEVTCYVGLQLQRVPCLGLMIVGKLDTFVFQGYLTIGCLCCDTTFYAVDRQIRLVSLTSTNCCIRSTSDGRDRKSLYRVFTAASVHIPGNSRVIPLLQKSQTGVLVIIQQFRSY